MREIKFRGKELGTGQWVYGNLVKLADGQVYIIPQNIIGDSIPQYSVDPKTVGQYTGLQDRNGNDIYEGDISEGEHAIYLILWDEQKAQFRAKVIKTKSVLIKHCSFPLWQYVENDEKCRFGIIGNRFDNPELLGEVRE